MLQWFQNIWFASEHAYQTFPQNFALILINYSFPLQCSETDHSENLSEEILNTSYKLLF